MGKAILVSACLLGVRCRYDGGDSRSDQVNARVADGQAVPVCPEELGGLPTPRARAWIEGGDGSDVLRGAARVLNEQNKDVTAQFLRGAREALAVARRSGATKAILKTRSPSCGAGQTYGTGNVLGSGDGVTAALLRREGIHVEAIE